MKTLILYYSYGGNTRRVAQMIQKEVGGDLAEIQTVQPYTGDYNAVVDQGQREIDSGFCPELKPLSVDLKDYDTVVLGSPVWWYTFAPAMHSFLKEADLAGKRVYPFATNGGWLGHTLKDFAKACKGAEVKPGLDVRFDGTRLRTPEQDAKIAGIAHERGKGIIIAVNKWDAIEKNDKTVYEYTNKIRNILSYMPYAEITFISAVTGQRLPKLFELIDMVIQNQNLRVATGVLNEIMTEAVALQQPPSDKGKRLKLFYITQVAVKPPTFVIFVNDKELMHFSYTRYLENKIRDAFGFKGTALRFLIRERKGDQ